MKIQGAVIREQGLTFAVVAVKPSTLDNKHRATEVSNLFEPIFGNIPVVLMAQKNGRTEYFGRHDISKFMSRVPLRAIPWREYTIN
jgi:hypothetical protein